MWLGELWATCGLCSGRVVAVDCMWTMYGLHMGCMWLWWTCGSCVVVM